MTKRIIPALILSASLLALSSCNSGPHRLRRGWEDYTNQKYTENPWIHGALLQDVIPIYPIVGFFLAIGDIVALNPYYFWSKDAWDGNGTGFDHEPLTGAVRSVGKAWN